MTIEEGLAFFESHPKIRRFLQCLHDVGLDYIKLGQPSTQLSGGEAQRVKLATELAKGGPDFAPAIGEGAKAKPRDFDDKDEDSDDVRLAGLRAIAPGARTLYILDEPTTGLHFEDIRKLLTVLHRLADSGNTLVIIEHNLDVIKCADWIVDLGPEGGDGGGRLVATGTPEQVAKIEKSFTGQYLRAVLARG